jgi:hypothetical protein
MNSANGNAIPRSVEGDRPFSYGMKASSNRHGGREIAVVN